VVTHVRKHLSKLLFSALLMGVFANGSPALAQPAGDFPIRDSSVGYIDDAIPGNMLRFRFDAAYENHRPLRGEFFYAPGYGFGPGLPKVERSVDYQDVMGYLELLLGEHVSFFAEVPTRFLNPEVNDNHAGLGDVNGGLKWAVLYGEMGTLSLQFRTYAPSGNPHLGLGTGHTTVEPGILFFLPLSENCALEGECEYLTPLGGQPISGDVMKYGLGLQCKVFESESFRVIPVIEAVGWTFLHGGDVVVFPSGDAALIGATGDTILNIKPGIRFGIGKNFDVFGGWSHPLTGDKFYENLWRVEMRFCF